MTDYMKRASFTFVELIASILVLAICIVPASIYMTDSMVLRRRLEEQRHLTVLAVHKIEQQMAIINASFTTAQQTGTFTAEGFPDMAFKIIRSDSSAAGGVSNLLMAVTVTVWTDKDADLVPDADETAVVLRTKMARSMQS